MKRIRGALRLSSFAAIGVLVFLQIPAEAEASNIASVVITNEGAAGNVIATFGHVFKAGDIPSGSYVGVTKPDGSSVAGFQVDVKATHPDGSVRHALVTVDMGNMGGGAAATIVITSTTIAPAGGAWTDKSTWLSQNAAFDANVSMTISGTTWTASARTLLSGDNPMTWLSGPDVMEWVVGAPLKDSSGNAHPHLAAYFHIRAPKGNGRARVDAIVENGWTKVAGSTSYSPTSVIVTSGTTPTTVYTSSTLVQYHHTRWSQRFWWGPPQSLFVRHDTQYLRSTCAVPNYDGTLTLSSALLDGFAQTYTPMSHGNYSTNWPSTGYQSSIGLLTEREAAYVISGDERAYKALIADGSAAGSYAFHYRDEASGKGGVPSIVTYPTLSYQGPSGGFVRGNDATSNPLTHDQEHQPSIGYLAYLLTGDYRFLEELMFMANWNLIWTGYDYRRWDGVSFSGGATGPYYGILQGGGTVRQFAWGLRSLAQAAYAVPDGFTIGNENYKTYFNDRWNANMAFRGNWVSPSNTAVSTLGVLPDWNNEPAHNPWEDDFVTATIGYAVNMGFTNATPFRNWLNRYTAGRMGSNPATEWCYIYATEYNLSAGTDVKRDGGGNWYTSYRSFYVGWMAAKHPTVDVNSCPAGQRMQLPASYSDMATGYYSNMQPALAAAVESGHATQAQWDLFRSAGTPDYTTAPVWAIVPRTPGTPGTKPAAPTGVRVR